MPEPVQSGRDFLQDLADRHDTEILRTTYFEILKSKRRLALLAGILAQVQTNMRRALLIHNLMTLREEQIFRETGIRNKAPSSSGTRTQRVREAMD